MERPMTYQNNNGLNDLIQEAGRRSGVDPASLKRTIDSGKLDDLAAKMKPKDAERLRQVLSNPKLAEQMLKTPQAQQLIRQFMKE
jgi:hypothetical protein